MPKPTNHELALAEAVQNLCQVIATAVPTEIPQVTKACELAEAVIRYDGKSDEDRVAELKMYGEEYDQLYVIWKGREHNNRKAGFKAYCAKRRAGNAHETLKQATLYYWRHCKQKQILATDKMMMTQTFYGKNDRWSDFLKETNGTGPKGAPPLPKL